ncbi:MAG: hypothetical protein KME54_24480 [Tolypothrix brevis GSE-NOS-MK-07-07A]|nr:hypothetical protein [Tolypothrix brevis GSE-NOS-MK-07-07A]
MSLNRLQKFTFYDIGYSTIRRKDVPAERLYNFRRHVLTAFVKTFRRNVSTIFVVTS